MEKLLRMRDRRVKRAAVAVAAILGLVLSAGAIRAQNNPDETAIRQILDSEVTACRGFRKPDRHRAHRWTRTGGFVLVCCSS